MAIEHGRVCVWGVGGARLVLLLALGASFGRSAVDLLMRSIWSTGLSELASRLTKQMATPSVELSAVAGANIECAFASIEPTTMAHTEAMTLRENVLPAKR